MRLKEKRLASNSDREKKVIGWSLVVAGLLVALDQLTKIMVMHHFVSPDRHGQIELIPDFFNLVYVHNNGAAWNMLAGQTWALLLFGVVIFILVLKFLRYLTEGWSERYLALFMVLSGIVGNTADRIWNSGSVIDFLDFNLGFYHWPAFNIADSAICVGACIYILSSFIRPDIEDEKEEMQPEQEEKNAG